MHRFASSESTRHPPILVSPVRLGLVPSSTHSEGSKHAVWVSRQDCTRIEQRLSCPRLCNGCLLLADPRYIGNDRGETYLEKNLDTSVLRYDANVTDAKTVERYLSTKPTEAIGFIPEVAYTASYIDGNYAISNEHGVRCCSSLSRPPPPSCFWPGACACAADVRRVDMRG